MNKLFGLIRFLAIWWENTTPGTYIWTRLYGQKVGEDEQGNVFYQSRGGERRWVIYNGVAEASRISPDWHGWMHHTYDRPPTEDALKRRPWEKDHEPNLTGTPHAYHPPGSVLTPATRPRVDGDYEAWSPE